MAILVTGAAGFIGSHVCEQLLLRGDEVIGVDNVNDYYSVDLKRSNIELLSSHKGFTFYETDITELSSLTEIFSSHKPNKVAHLAARAGVRPSIDAPFLYKDSNITGTMNLLELSKEQVENFVLTSSSSVYGNSRAIPFQEEDSATDKPNSP